MQALCPNCGEENGYPIAERPWDSEDAKTEYFCPDCGQTWLGTAFDKTKGE